MLIAIADEFVQQGINEGLNETCQMQNVSIIHHQTNINVLVESVLVLSGNLNFFCSSNAFKLMLLVMCMLNVKQI